MRNVRVLRHYVAMNVMNTLEYRGAIFIYVFNTVAAPVVYLLVWLTVSAQGVALPYDRSQFVTYYVLLSLTSMFTGTWLAGSVANSIRTGGLSSWLLEPVPYILHYVGNNIGEKIIKLPLILPLVALVALIFHNDLHLPTNPAAWLLYAVSVVLAATVAFLLDCVIASLAFWLQDVKSLIRVKDLAGAFLAGSFVPLALFPPSLAPLLEAQPFRYTLSFPLELLTGSLTPQATLRGFLWQIGYCLGFFALYRVLWLVGLRSYEAPGS